uniref:hypothetical protein n=1 Tax=Solidesulfovibrio alcoholivorans TaxID=81406 RepID=UPI001B80CE0D
FFFSSATCPGRVGRLGPGSARGSRSVSIFWWQQQPSGGDGEKDTPCFFASKSGQIFNVSGPVIVRAAGFEKNKNGGVWEEIRTGTGWMIGFSPRGSAAKRASLSLFLKGLRKECWLKKGVYHPKIIRNNQKHGGIKTPYFAYPGGNQNFIGGIKTPYFAYPGGIKTSYFACWVFHNLPQGGIKTPYFHFPCSPTSKIFRCSWLLRFISATKD